MVFGLGPAAATDHPRPWLPGRGSGIRADRHSWAGRRVALPPRSVSGHRPGSWTTFFDLGPRRPLILEAELLPAGIEGHLLRRRPAAAVNVEDRHRVRDRRRQRQLHQQGRNGKHHDRHTRAARQPDNPVDPDFGGPTQMPRPATIQVRCANGPDSVACALSIAHFAAEPWPQKLLSTKADYRIPRSPGRSGTRCIYVLFKRPTRYGTATDPTIHLHHGISAPPGSTAREDSPVKDGRRQGEGIGRSWTRRSGTMDRAANSRTCRVRRGRAIPPPVGRRDRAGVAIPCLSAWPPSHRSARWRCHSAPTSPRLARLRASKSHNRASGLAWVSTNAPAGGASACATSPGRARRPTTSG